MREERFLRGDKKIIRDWCDVLNVDMAGVMEVYYEVIDAGKLGPRRASTVIAASIYISTRRNNEPITIHEIVKCTGEAKSIVEKTLRGISSGLPPQNANTFVIKGLKRLNLPDNMLDSVELNKVRYDLGAPIRAAMALFVVAHRENPAITIKDTAIAVGVATETLRKYVGRDGTLKKAAM